MAKVNEVILSPYAKRVKKYYNTGLWHYEQVEEVYNKGKLTAEEFREIIEGN